MGDINDLFIMAASKGQLKAVKKYLAEGADIDARNKNGMTALMKASSTLNKHDGHGGLIQYLLEKGADTSLTNDYGSDVFVVAEIHGNHDLLELINGFIEQDKLEDMINNAVANAVQLKF